MAERKTPAANGRGVEMLPGDFRAPFTLAAYRAQSLAARFAIPIETAALVAALAWGGAGHG